MISMFVKYCGIHLFVGLSTDEKPLNAPNASRFFEMDTKFSYVFDKENNVWIKQGDNPEPVGGDEMFYVTFTENNGTWTADKTLDEVKQAYENKQMVAGIASDIDGLEIITPLLRIDEFSAEFYQSYNSPQLPPREMIISYGEDISVVNQTLYATLVVAYDNNNSKWTAYKDWSYNSFSDIQEFNEYVNNRPIILYNDSTGVGGSNTFYATFINGTSGVIYAYTLGNAQLELTTFEVSVQSGGGDNSGGSTVV